MTRTAKLVCFGLAGDTVEYGGGCCGSRYGTPENPHAAKSSNHNIPDGTPAIDKRPALKTKAGYRWAFQGPMVNVDLQPAQVDRCPTPSPIMVQALTDDPNNEFGQLAVLQAVHQRTSQEPGPLDAVDTRTYIEGWRQRGARIGHYRDGAIIWE